MVDRKDLLALNFYIKGSKKKKENPFFGSLNNMHYKIRRIEVPDPERAGEDAEAVKDVFHVTYWPGPYTCDKTDDSLKQEAQFPFSEEGLCQVADFLNDRYEKQKELWTISTMR